MTASLTDSSVAGMEMIRIPHIKVMSYMLQLPQQIKPNQTTLRD